MKRFRANSGQMRLRGSLAGILAIAVGLLAPGMATAAPGLLPTVTHSSTVNRGDAYMTYAVTVKNTAVNSAGTVLTCKANNWTPASGVLSPGFSYQWLRGGVPITGATNSTYTTSASSTTTPATTTGDAGGAIQCVVTATNTAAASSAASPPFVVPPAPPVAPPAPTNPTAASSRPTIAGTGADTVQRTCTIPSSWSGSPTFSYQWLQNGIAVPSATGTATTALGSSSLTAVAAATGSGTLASGSRNVTGLTTTTGAFAVGQTVTAAAGIPANTTIAAIRTGELELSAPATASGAQSLAAHAFSEGEAISGAGIPTGVGSGDLSSGSPTVNNVATSSGTFAVGQLITGSGIPANTTILAVGAGSLTLSANAAASGTGVALAGRTTITAVSGQTLTISTAATAAAAGVAVSATATTPKLTPRGATGKVLQCQVTETNAGGAAVAISNNNTVGTVTNPPANTEANTPSIASENDTSSPVNLAINLPAGMTIDAGTGTNWTCFLTPKTCTYSGTIAAGATSAQLSVGVSLDEASMPAMPTVTVTAFGGGALSPGIGQETFTLGPQLVFGAIPSSFKARAEDELGADYTQAGGHPFKATTAFDMTTKQAQSFSQPFENVRDGAINLPPGFVANPTAVVGGCEIGQVSTGTCPDRYAVGRANADLVGNPGLKGDKKNVVYKIEAEDGYPVAFAFRPINESGVTVVVRPKIRPGDFTATAFIPRPVQNPALWAVTYFTVCSFGPEIKLAAGGGKESPGCKKPGDAGALGTPIITNPTRCNGQPDVIGIDLASYQHPGAFDDEGFPDLSDPDWKSTSTTSPPLTGCNNLEFEPTFEGRPTTNVADAPTGLDFNLHIPQHGLVGEDENGDPAPNALAAAHLKDTTVTLPEGMVVNPSAATGLEACTSEQMGLVQTDHSLPYAIRFDGKPVDCPAGSKIGTVTIESPLVEQTVEGGVYLGKQFDNPFNSLLAIYIAVRNDEIGLSAKLAGKVTPDPVTGQLTAVFNENPQLPFEDLKLKFFEGARASLRTPATCGQKTTDATFTPWSAPQSGPPAERSDSYAITTAPGGGNCAQTAAELPNAPRLTAGTVTPKAGAYSPFVLRLARDDGSQELKGVNATLPPGLTGRLAGVPYCSEAAIQQAAARSKPGEGAIEQSSPSCPAASQLGTVDVAAGAGPLPFHAGGKAYLAGPYKGAPVSMVVVTPAIAGPFDLGTVVVRNALYINPVTTQVSVKSDPIPTILEGIPLDVRSIEVRVDRDQFTLNPTNCEPLSLGATAVGMTSEAALTNPFQVGECKALKFKPGLKLQMHGPTKRAEYQQLTATVTYPKGNYANISRASVALPHSAFLAQEHIRTVCTRVQFAAKECPKGSIYGSAEATTPLLDEPLKGPVYLRSSNNPLPDLVVALRGPDSQPVEVELAGRTDSVHGGIRNTFDVVPDAPVSKFRLRLLGGDKSLIVNSRDLCKGVQRATVRFDAQNGRRYDFRPVVHNDCGKHRGGKKAKGGKHGGSAGSSQARALKAG